MKRREFLKNSAVLSTVLTFGSALNLNANENLNTRSEKMDTKIILTINKEVIPATLNSTIAAQEFIKKLPFSLSASKGEFDFCGMGGELKYDPSQTQVGWKNGDIGYARGWFAIFHSGEERSSEYTSEMIIGHIDEKYLQTIKNLPHSVKISVELAK